MGLHPNTLSPLPQHHLYYHFRHQTDRYGSSAGSVRSKVWFSLLLWALGISSVLLFSISYSPNPFGVTPFRVDDDVDVETCDLAVGEWVRDEQRSSCTNRGCGAPPESKNCEKYGKGTEYLNWKWKPTGCELPSFDPRTFLGIVRGRKMAFVGDDVAESQVESLRCLLSQVQSSEDKLTDTEDRLQEWYYPSHNFTLTIMRTRFLVMGEERIQNGTASGDFDVHLDRIDMSWASKVDGTDYIVISCGHSWFFGKIYLHVEGNLAGCVFCSDPNLKDLGVAYAIQRSFRTAVQYIGRCTKCDKVLTILRTFSPAHLENGSWNSEGYCNHTVPLSERDTDLGGTLWELRHVQLEELGRVREQVNGGRTRFGVLDVTKAMLLLLMRPDGHSNSHWNSMWQKGYNDSLQWCVPIPIGMWNDMLLAILNRFYS